MIKKLCYVTDEEIKIVEIVDDIMTMVGKFENIEDKIIIKKYLKINSDLCIISFLISRKIYLQAHYELEKLYVWVIENVESCEKYQELI